MKQKLLLIVILLTSYSVNAQTYVEKLGHAMAGYYGSTLTMNLIADAGCKQFLRVNPDLYRTYAVRQEILAKLKNKISKKDYDDLPNFFTGSELDIKKNFGNVFKNLNSEQCQKATLEVESLFTKNKNQWDALFK